MIAISPSPPNFKIAPSLINSRSSPTVMSVDTTIFPVPAGVKFMSAFDPFETTSFVVTLVAVTAPAKVPAPSTSKLVLFNGFGDLFWI